MRIRAAQQDPELRTYWIQSLSNWTAEQLVLVDESAANERTGYRKCGWAPVGVTPSKSRPFVRSERWSLLPAYTSKGFMTWEIVHSSYTAQSFENFIENQLLPLCNPFPLEHSVIVMDNAPIHQSKVSTSLLLALMCSACKKCAIMLASC